VVRASAKVVKHRWSGEGFSNTDVESNTDGESNTDAVVRVSTT
jgi:hypothetical protein